jgi:hypothetical protein
MRRSFSACHITCSAATDADFNSKAQPFHSYCTLRF